MEHRRRFLHLLLLKMCTQNRDIDDNSMVGQYFDHKQFFINYVYERQDDSSTVIFEMYTDFSWISAITILLDK